MEYGRQSRAAFLPNELVTEILTRVPAKSLCRFNCVSRSWRALISDIAHRASLTQAPTGFFFFSERELPHSWGFVSLPTSSSSLPPVDPALYLTASSDDDEVTELLDSSNGLLLLRCRSPSHNNGVAFYVVCNPATGERVTLPQPSVEPGSFNDDTDLTSFEHAVLAFDPAISPHDFHVFQLVEEELEYNHYVTAAEIYSSATGTWVLRERTRKWGRPFGMFFGHSFYFNGFQHLSWGLRHIGLVDTTGRTWRTMNVNFPGCSELGFLGHSQGRLLYIIESIQGPDAWVIYVLEDHDRDEWTFKHRVSKQALFGTPSDDSGWEPVYSVAAIHPECDLIFFFDRRPRKLMSYDMSKGNVRVLCTLDEELLDYYPFLRYVPLYTRTLSLPDAS